MQRMMLEEVLRLHTNHDTKRREYRVRQDMVEKASRLMMEAGMLRRPVTYQELLGL
jgi:NitT/TauT family transport system substrate-binding protein